ncbi:MAG: molybdopterin oxidoreductase, partial [Janthinobacterium lividum]
MSATVPVDVWRAPGGPTPEALEALALEFPMLARLPGMDRRTLLRVMGASLAMAGLAGCKPERSADAVPYVTQPEGITVSEAQYYATAVPFDGWAQPALATAYVGRPTRLDGNPDHPASRGKSDPFLQAAVLDLYDPDRSQAVSQAGTPAAWSAFDTALAGWRRDWGRTGGAGVHLLLGPNRSPTLAAQLDRLQAMYPRLGLHRMPAASDGLRAAAATAAFGRPLAMHVALDRARTVVSLDDDLLGPGPWQVANMLAWSTRRGEAADRQHLYVAEPTPTLTGAVADSRRAVAAGRIPLLVAAIAAHVGLGAMPAGLTTAESAWAVRMAAALRRDAGASLLAVGATLPPATQALGFAVNDALGNTGRTLWWAEPAAMPGGDVAALAAELAAGRVDTLLALDANPVYALPWLGWRQARLRLHAGLHVDETAAQSHWHLPLHHPLEMWSDGRAVDGTATLTQPLVEPLYDTRSVHGIVAALAGDTRDDRSLVRATWPM